MSDSSSYVGTDWYKHDGDPHPIGAHAAYTERYWALDGKYAVIFDPNAKYRLWNGKYAVNYARIGHIRPHTWK
jgi:hypothetical protein